MIDLKNFHFVALDLETTGLSPDKDTIIEVAALRFSLEREGDVFQAVNIEEQSMLIDPEQEISEQISMITGISNSMVVGKSKWREVRERVEAFIGDDTIILGHNVLFDVGMLRTHGIDLREHTVLDTFELSELFSTDAESLNLGFLGKKYGLDDGSEHRALDDTRLSMRLFLHYMGDICTMSESERSLWHYARDRDTGRSIDTLLEIIGDTTKREIYKSDYLSTRIGGVYEEYEKKPLGDMKLISLGPDWEGERSIINEGVKRGKVLLFTSSKKQSEWLMSKFPEYKIAHHIDHESIISVSLLRAFLERKQWKRKETILIIRLMKWFETTETGSIDELKWYGEEISYKNLMRSGPDEMTHYHEKNLREKASSDIVIAECSSRDSRERISRDHSTLIVRDVVELDQALRYRESQKVIWKDLYRYIDIILEDDTTMRESLVTAVSLLEEIVCDVISRPTGPSISPPGDYGETYFYSQQDLWHRGHIWLIYAHDQIRDILEKRRKTTREEGVISEKYFSLFLSMLDPLLRVRRDKESNIGCVLQIKNNETELHLIPRSMRNMISSFLEVHRADKTIMTSQGLDSVYISEFLQTECGISAENPGTNPDYKLYYTDKISLAPTGRTVILGTNLKSLRSISTEIRKRYPEKVIYTQGVSGGKGKMKTLFEKASDSVLIGLIDTWKDESKLWEGVETVIITKVPFDPPTDPYYLARTVGMANNFENYSLPLAIYTITTLIARIRYAQSRAQISLTDEKVMTMTWGRELRVILKI